MLSDDIRPLKLSLDYYCGLIGFTKYSVGGARVPGPEHLLLSAVFCHLCFPKSALGEVKGIGGSCLVPLGQ